MNRNRTVLLVFEGCDGAGKGTQIRLLTQALENLGYSVVLFREPGGTDIGEQIRNILLDSNNTEITSFTELLLYMAARGQLMKEVLIPELESGNWDLVILDRYWFSSAAFQGGARGLGLEIVFKLADIVCQPYTYPDAVIYLDIPAEIGLARLRSAAAGGREFNRLDKEDLNFHRKVRKTYLHLAKILTDIWHTIDSNPPVDVVHNQVLSTVLELLNK